MRRVLLERGYEAGLVEATLDRLAGERALDDGRLARQVARSRLANQGQGPLRIRRELGRRGVGRATVEQGMAEALAEVPQAEVIDTLARRYWARKATSPRDDPATRLRRLWAFLVRRGFPSGAVSARLRVLWPRLGDALEGLEPAAEDE